MTRLEDPPPWLRPAYCFASVTENKDVTISDRFILFYFDSKTIGGVGGLCFEGDD